MIFVGFRNDLGTGPVFPEPSTPDAYTIRDALPWIETDDEPSLSDHDLQAANIERFAIYEEWVKLSPGQSSDRYFNLVRPDPDRPCPTITQTGGNPGAAAVAHPSEPRKFTVAEARRLCSFPDDFVLTGDYRQQYERLGRAVPPLLMKAVAETVRDRLLAS
jgi:DNA (cytosine-5)-methyltransferase 1